MSQHNPKKGCSFCERQVGLPIFPVRYAVARQGLGNAPKCTAPFDPTACGGAQKANLTLPASMASDNEDAPFTRGGYYTNRLLRGGFLYVYIEHRKEWQSYYVMNEGVLYPFKRGDKPPKGKLPNVKSCSADGCKETHDLHKFIYVQDADEATNVWLAFSDAPWTEAVWEQYDSAVFRQAHMRQFNVAEWRASNQQPHVDALDALDQRVAEYAATRKALYDETVKYINKLMPKGWTIDKIRGETGVAQAHIKGYSKKAKAVLPSVPKLIQNLACNLGENYDAPDSAAWQFSTEPFFIQEGLNESYVELVTRNIDPQGNDIKPAMVGLDDPAGVAMDLNGLMIQQIIEATADPAYQWKLETASTISSLRETKRQQAITEESHKRRHRKYSELFWGIEDPLDWFKDSLEKRRFMQDGQQLPSDVRQLYLKEVDEAGELTSSEAKTIGNDAWKDYANRYNTDALNDFVSNENEHVMKKTAPLRALLDVPYVSWLENQCVSDYFQSNFDTNDMASGTAYVQLARLVLNEASGRATVAEFLQKQLRQAPTNQTQWVMRAFFANQSHLVEAATQTDSGDSNDFNAMADTLCAAFDKISPRRMDQLGDNIACYLQQISGPLLSSILEGESTALTRLKIVTLGALAKLEDPSLQLVVINGKWGRQEAIQALAGMLEQLHPDQLPSTNRKRRRAMQKLAQTEQKDFTVQGIMLVGAASLLPAALRENRLNQALQEGLEDSIAKLKTLNVKAGVVGTIFAAFTLSLSYEGLLKAPAKKIDYALANLTSGVTGLLSGLFGIAGKARLLAEGRTEAMTLRAFVRSMGRGATLADCLSITARLFGAVAGAIGAFFLWKKGWDELDDNLSLGALHIVEAGLVAGSTLALFIGGALLTPIGIALAIIVVLIDMMVILLTADNLQVWLNRSHYFGRHLDLSWHHFQSDEDKTPFKSPIEQRESLYTMMHGA